MSWRNWLVGCLVAGLVGVVLGTVHAGLTGSGMPVSRSGSAPAQEAAGLPVPHEQAAARTSVPAVPPGAAATGRGNEAGPDWGSEQAKRPKPAKAPKAREDGGQGTGKHQDERDDDGDDRGRGHDRNE
jgi:hypothetical protein